MHPIFATILLIPPCLGGDNLKKLPISYSTINAAHHRQFHQADTISIDSPFEFVKIDSDYPVIYDGLLNIQGDVHYFIMDSRNLLKIESDAFTGQNIHKAISLRLNQLTELVEHSFVDLENVEEIHLEGNHITHIHEESFVNMPNLEILNLAHNDLVEYHENSFVQTPILRSLDMNFNKLKKLHKLSFMDAQQESMVKVQDNHINVVEADCFKDVNVNTLNLKQNRLEFLPEDMFEDNKFERLFLDDNLIEVLPDTFYRQDNLKELSIYGNPLECSEVSRLRSMANEKNFRISLDHIC